MERDVVAEIRQVIQEDIRLGERVRRMVEILLGNIHRRYPATLREYLQEHGVSAEAFEKMSGDELIQTWRAIREKEPRGPSTREDLICALDLIFEARYGWPQGTAGKLNFAEAFIAVEHATEYDNPSRPSIWEITR